jgi:hypothetical protein
VVWPLTAYHWPNMGWVEGCFLPCAKNGGKTTG